MNILEFADVIDATLIIRRYANQNNRWSVHFEYCEVKDRSVLASISGEGRTPQVALDDYVDRIKGKLLVFHAMSETIRKEYTCPKYVESVILY